MTGNKKKKKNETQKSQEDGERGRGGEKKEMHNKSNGGLEGREVEVSPPLFRPRPAKIKHLKIF